MPYGKVHYREGPLSDDELAQIEEAVTDACLLFDCEGGEVASADIEVLLIGCDGSLTEPLIEIQARRLPAREANWPERKQAVCDRLQRTLPVGVGVVVRLELVDGYIGVKRII